MNKFHLKINSKPKLNNPVLIEGLPGIGHVGKVAAQHLASELRAKKFGTLYSQLYPPQVLINKDGTIENMKNDLYYWKAVKKEQRDILFVIGNTQSATSEGQFQLSEKILDIASEYNVKMVYTLGGLGIGRMVEKPKVFGAVTNNKFIPELEKLKVILKREGIGQIIGVSGMLLGLGKLRGMEGVCLMGETSGYYIDPTSAAVVLKVLTKLLDVRIDMKKLTEKAKVAEKEVAEAQKMEKKVMEQMGMVQKELSEDEMRYIG